MISNQNLRVSCKPVNPQDCAWKNLYRITMKTILQEEGTIHCNIIIWYTNLFLCLKPWRFPQQKHKWIKNGRNLKKSGAGPEKSLKKIRGDRWCKDEGRQSSFLPHWWTNVIWRMPNWRQSTKNTKVEFVLRGDIVKDDSGSFAVFTEQGSSASQMTAAKVMDIISRLPGCTSSWCSICTCPGKNGRCSKIMKKSECPDIWIRLPRHKWPKSRSSMEDPVVPLERNLYGHLLAGLLWERQFEKIPLNYGWEKVYNWECPFVHREKGWFLSVYVDDIKLAGKTKYWSDVEITKQRSWFGFGMSVLFRRIDFGGVMSWKYATQLSCIRKLTFRWILSQFLITSFHRLRRSIVTSIWDGFSFLPISLFQHSHSTFVIIRFRPFCRLLINLTMCEWALFTKPTTTLGLVVQAFWRVPFFTKWVIASSSKVILARPSRHSTTWTLTSGTSGPRWFSLTLLHERIRRRIWWCNFSTLIDIVAETAIVSFHTLPVSFPLPTIS